MTDVRGDERGAMAISVALLLVVLLSMGAFTVDVGALYVEARELQNGADAAALAIAEDCALGDCGSYELTAQRLVDGNALDGETAVDAVTIDLDAQTVRVETSTLDQSGGTNIAYSFAKLLGFSGDTVHRAATATWAVPQSSEMVVPLTISSCEYEWANEHMLGEPIVFTFHDDDKNENAACPTEGGSGQDLPGGFGWLLADDCQPDFESVPEEGVWVGSENGTAPPSSCTASDFPIGTTIVVAVYDDLRGQGSGEKGGSEQSDPAQFKVVGFAAIELTGFRLQPGGGSGWDAGDVPCEQGDDKPDYLGGGTWTGNNTVCIGGTFLGFVDPTGTGGGSSEQDFGTKTVSLTG